MIDFFYKNLHTKFVHFFNHLEAYRIMVFIVKHFCDHCSHKFINNNNQVKHLCKTHEVGEGLFLSEYFQHCHRTGEFTIKIEKITNIIVRNIIRSKVND